jgi:hypothetical protein
MLDGDLIKTDRDRDGTNRNSAAVREDSQSARVRRENPDASVT